MKSKLLPLLFLLLLFILLAYFAHPLTRQLKIIAGIVMALGVIALIVAARIEEKEKGFKDLLRDIGIACFVAVAVTVMYEASTRTIEEDENIATGINKAMRDILSKPDWEEMKQELIYRQRFRRNVAIEFKISRKARLSDGKYVNAPPGLVILWMKYGYDLYAITSGAAYEPVRHELAYEMWNPELQLPRFEKVSVIRGHEQKVDSWEGERLKRIIVEEKSIVLGPDIVKLPSPQSKQPVRIESERYELMSAPGAYNLVIPELTLRADDPTKPTIKVDVTELPPDLEVRLDTYYAEHQFTPTGGRDNSWIYSNLMLPGQSLTLILQSKPMASVGAPSVKQ